MWHFFATSHGKGVCDGIGGTIKRLAARASLQNVLIKTAYDMYIFCIEKISAVKFFYVTQENVSETVDMLEKRYEH